MQLPTQPLVDARAAGVLDRLHRAADAQQLGIALRFVSQLPSLMFGKGIRFDPAKEHVFDDKYISIDCEQGRLLYLLARATGARHVVEFGTSFGVSTIYLACAVRDNGGGKVIGSELLMSKTAKARSNLEEAGVAQWVEVRQGDGLQTLKRLDHPVDFLLLDGFPGLALDALKTVEPNLRPGALIVVDDARLFQRDLKPLVAYLDEPINGYRTAEFPICDGFLLAVRNP